MVTVNYDDLSTAFDFVSFAAPSEHQAFVSLDTGAIHWISETGAVDDELPDDLETSDRYIAVPHRNDLDLGRSLALRFVDEQLPGQSAAVRAIFQHRGAYARFKDLLTAEGQLEHWYAFEAESTRLALRQWCKEHQIQLAEDSGQGSLPPVE